MGLRFFLYSFLLFCLVEITLAQPPPRYSFSCALVGGQSYIKAVYPNPGNWRFLWRPSISVNTLFHCRLNRKWELNGGIGIMRYSYYLKDKEDVYDASFLLRYAKGGIKFHSREYSGNSRFIQMNIGVQPSFPKSFEEEFQNYTARITGKNTVQIFVSPELGIRKRHKKDGYYEFSFFYQYGATYLGDLALVKNIQVTSFSSRGSYFGFSARSMIAIIKKKRVAGRRFNSRRAVCP